MTLDRINQALEKVRLQIAELQAKEKDLVQQKEDAEIAQTMKLVRKYRISPERLELQNRLSESEIKKILDQRQNV